MEAGDESVETRDESIEAGGGGGGGGGIIEAQATLCNLETIRKMKIKM